MVNTNVAYNGPFMKLLLLLPIVCSAQHLANLNQLTHGGQNAEAYWSPDGKRLIYQATPSAAAAGSTIAIKSTS